MIAKKKQLYQIKLNNPIIKKLNAYHSNTKQNNSDNKIKKNNYHHVFQIIIIFRKFLNQAWTLSFLLKLNYEITEFEQNYE